MSEHHDDGGTPPGPPDSGDAKSGDGRSEEQRTATAPGERPLGAPVSREELEKKVAELSRKPGPSLRKKDPWRTFGIFKDDPDFQEAVRLGREYREQQTYDKEIASS